MQSANLATGVILARGLGPALRGELAALTALVISLTVLTGFSFQDAMVYWLSRTKPDHHRHAGSGILFATVCGLGGSAALLLLSPMLVQISGLQAALLWPWFFFPISYQLALASVSLARGIQSYTSWVILRISTTANYAVLLALLLVFHRLGASEIGMAAVGGQLLTLALACALLHQPLRTLSVDWPSLRAIGTYAAKLHPVSFSGIAREQLDKIILFYLVPAPDLGRYVVGVALGLLPIAAAGTIEQVLFPSLVGIADPAARRQACLRQMRIMAALMLCGMIVAIPLTPLFVRILFGSEFLADVGIPIAAVMIGFLQSFKTIFNVGLKAEFKPGLLGRNEIIGTAVSLLLIVPLVLRLGIYGAPLASAIGSSLALCLTVRNIALLYGVPLHAILVPKAGDLSHLLQKLSGRQAS